MSNRLRVRVTVAAGAVLAVTALAGCGSGTAAAGGTSGTAASGTSGTAASGTSGTAASSSATAASGAQAQPTAQEVQALFGEWNRALATLDPGKVAERYTADAVLLPTVSNKVRTGHAEIADYFEHFLQGKPQGQILDSRVWILGPDTALDAGTYRFTTDSGTVDARYTFVYERANGTWLIKHHHSSAMPEKK
ncbi:SgcJ/EcaC family oxidoreductase [Saccharothrix variisporea]|uniref:Uncharacterized protein (TIGR02246 family) n=1 Tax=Saccharothrix variisporea TaxID=543527 RepID=A0A495XT64_9PSEU|nr:SgcJ/EcaC family oxidoreductase [Saccharothrix variisporea]RKT74858.1 uncharacterized protein (TIGR02246 family) [Saccharothrix variisporea]